MKQKETYCRCCHLLFTWATLYSNAIIIIIMSQEMLIHAQWRNVYITAPHDIIYAKKLCHAAGFMPAQKAII